MVVWWSGDFVEGKEIILLGGEGSLYLCSHFFFIFWKERKKKKKFAGSWWWIAPHKNEPKWAHHIRKCKCPPTGLSRVPYTGLGARKKRLRLETQPTWVDTEIPQNFTITLSLSSTPTTAWGAGVCRNCLRTTYAGVCTYVQTYLLYIYLNIAGCSLLLSWVGAYANVLHTYM